MNEICGDSVVMYVCGSNFFGQIDAACHQEVSKSVSLPTKVLDFMKTPLKAGASKNSSAIGPPYDICATWDRIVCCCGESLHVQGFGAQVTSKSSVSRLACNAKCTCIVSRSHELEILSHPDLKVMERQMGKRPKVKCIGCTENKVLVVTDDDGNSVWELDTSDVKLPSNRLECQLPIRAVSCGKEHALFLSTLGTVLSYGAGSRGQLGHGTTEACSNPTVIEALNGVSMLAIAAGGWHSAVVSEIGDLYIWGWNESGQLGFPCSQNVFSEHRQKEVVNILTTPSLLEIQPNDQGQMETDGPDAELSVRKVACGSRHTLCLTECGRVFCFGWNTHGQLGLGDTVLRDQPTELTFFTKASVLDICAGGWNSVFVVKSET